MTKETRYPTGKQFSVKIGHTEVVVDAASAEDAVRNARRQLGQELPRMWDVIYRLDDVHFQVTPLHER